MEKRKLGKTDIDISAITFGCWAIGAGSEWGKNFSDIDYIKTVNAAYENGINSFDTASGYGNGHSEEVLGRAVHSFREKIIISSKCGAAGLVKGTAEKSVDESLKRLNTEYIDIFFIHWPHPDIDIRENMETLMKLKKKGKIRAVGVSNYTVNHLKKAVEEGVVDVFQPCYNLFWRNIEDQSLPYCMLNQISIMTYSSIASGLLTGKFSKDWHFEDEDMRNRQIALFKEEVFERAVDVTDRLKVFSARYQRTMTQLAINWVIRTKGITSAIVGAKTVEQVLENVHAADFMIEEEDYLKMAVMGREVADLVKDWDTLYQKNDQRLILK